MPTRTFRIDRLYYQFLKPKDIPIEKLETLVARLYQHGFIMLYENPNLSDQRYSELDKLTKGQDRDELFKIVNTLKYKEN